MTTFIPERRLIRNAAKCTACGEVIESNHRHDFNAHYCKVAPATGPCGTETFRFAVDGGLGYVRRVGTGFEDCNEWSANDDR